MAAAEIDLGRHQRAELLELLLRDGILYASADQPVVSGTGRPAPWMLDSLGATLGPVGGELAARCLLRALEDFEGRQLATYGVTGLPLLMGCVLGSGGRYRGIVVRKQPRPHGSLKQIEGRYDPSEPVVIIDDSICSGYSMRTCAQRLEGAGMQVEGAISLVRFGYDPGVVSMLDRGYRIATVFDLYQDFVDRIDGEAPYAANPTKEPFSLHHSERPAQAGLHPAALARLAMAEYLSTGRLLAAPGPLDRDYDGAGGCFVSVRRSCDVHDRRARSGFWHFPGEPAGTVAGDVARAAVQTARQLQRATADPVAELEECSVAVTFFEALEECTVGALDNDRFGIVIRSTDRPHRMGGALPCMPGVAGERQQFAHALRNAGLHRLENYRLYRHGVVKAVEPGAMWQPTGVPEAGPVRDPGVARLALVAWRALDPTSPSGTDLAGWPDPDATVFATVYAGGRLVGCRGGPLGAGPDALESYVGAALDDDRFPGVGPGDALAVAVSMLTDRHEIGQAAPAWVPRPTRFAEQALEVWQGARRGLLLPSVAVTNNLTPEQYVEEVIDKAGITRPPYHWARYDVVTALADAGGVREMEHGLPRGDPAAPDQAQMDRLHRLLLGYARRHHRPEGPPVGRYEPFADRLRTGISGARLAYGAWVKGRAGLVSEAQDDLRRLERGLGEDGWIRFGDDPPSISELAFVLLAELEIEGDRGLVAGLSSKLWSQIDGHGRFATHRDTRAGTDAYQDYGPGQALLALAHAAGAGATGADPVVLGRALRYYRMRFRQNHHWGAVAWLAQAFGAWGRVGHDPAPTASAYHVVDWALQFQSEKTGGFLNDHQPDSPGATTAVYLEAVAAARAAAERDGDHEREVRYQAAAARSLRFLDRLVYQERDAAVLPNPIWAQGGLRTSLTASDVRIDYVHHGLAAVLALMPASGAP